MNVIPCKVVSVTSVSVSANTLGNTFTISTNPKCSHNSSKDRDVLYQYGFSHMGDLRNYNVLVSSQNSAPDLRILRGQAKMMLF